MHYIYIIKSINHPEKIYLGYTLNFEARLQKHNEGGSVYTANFRPWELITYLVFTDKSTVIAFEKYLKSHSGRAFLQKRLI